MQRLRFALRVSLLMAVVVLTLGAMGNMSFGARDAFDDDYTDCPSDTRLEAVSGLKVARTAEADELKVSWDMTNPASWGLGSRFAAKITVIVDDGDDPQEASLALGDNEALFQDIDLAEDLEISVAVVRDKHVISDIAVAEFTSGLAAPKFSSSFYLAKTDVDDIFRDKLDAAFDADDNPRALAELFDDDGNAIAGRASVHKPGDDTSTFYYLGFNHSFDNWYADVRTSGNERYPRTPRFRIGLRHGSDDPDDKPGDADFEHFRIRVTDSSGDDVLGFDAATVADSVYDGRVLVLGTVQTDSTGNNWVVDETSTSPPYFANIKRSNRVDDPTDAYYASSHVFWTRYTTGSNADFPQGTQVRGRRPDLVSTNDAELGFKLSFNNLLPMERIGGFTTSPSNQRQLFALPPVEIYDMAPDVFNKDGNYVFEAWAEDEDGIISPKTSITLNIREQYNNPAKSNLIKFEPASTLMTNNYYDFGGHSSYRSATKAVVLGLSIFND